MLSIDLRHETAKRPARLVPRVALVVLFLVIAVYVIAVFAAGSNAPMQSTSNVGQPHLSPTRPASADQTFPVVPADPEAPSARVIEGAPPEVLLAF